MPLLLGFGRTEFAAGLLLRHDDGTLRAYLFREVEFVIAGR